MELSSPVNPFRAQWLYRRLPAGDAAITAGKGLSPAFMKLLEAVDATAPVLFTALEARFAHLDADDLELWLAELCRMRLIVPAQETAAALPSADPAALFAADAIHAPGPRAAAEAKRPDLLLVHKLPSTRAAWRDLLAALPLNLHEAGTLEEAGEAYNRLLPAGVLVGPEGGDFNALSMIHLLKHPRAPRVTKVILVLDERRFSPKIKHAAASADDTVAPEAWDSLAERVARLLSLPPAVAAAARPLRLMEEKEERAEALRAGLEHEHPRVAAVVADQWGQSTLDSLFDELIFDTRGDGHIFSNEAMQDLLFLYRIHCELRPGDAWRTTGMPRARRAHIAALRATGRHRTLSATQRLRVL